MRFVFENGGRSGCQSAEALADYMEEFVRFTPQQPMSIQPGRIEIFDAGRLMVDFSPGRNGPGETFREAGRVRLQILKAVQAADTEGERRAALRKLAASYWAEGEALELSRATEASASRQSSRL